MITPKKSRKKFLHHFDGFPNHFQKTNKKQRHALTKKCLAEKKTS